MKQNLIQEKSFDFALLGIEIYKEMIKNKEFVLSKQLLKSGTSIGANLEEALEGISKKDFTSKMSISSKEARESNYWLRLIEKSKIVDIDVAETLIQITSIINILTKIVKTSQTQLSNQFNIKN